MAALIALGDNSPAFGSEYEAIGTAPGFYDDWQEGRDPVGISTQDDELAARFDPELGGRRLANYLRTMVLETQTLARACGKSHVQNLEPEDLVALTVEAAAMAQRAARGHELDPGGARQILSRDDGGVRVWVGPGTARLGADLERPHVVLEARPLCPRRAGRAARARRPRVRLAIGTSTVRRGAADTRDRVAHRPGPPGEDLLAPQLAIKLALVRR